MIRSNKKPDRNQQIMEMIKTHSEGEVAEAFGISRQRVDQIVRRMGGFPKGRPTHVGKSFSILNVIIPKLGKEKDSIIANEFGLYQGTITNIRAKNKIKKFVKNPVIGNKAVCCDCRKLIPLKEMAKDSTRKHGVHPRCKKCLRAYARERYEKLHPGCKHRKPAW